MALHLLGTKSWHVYNADNVARVRRDEATVANELAAQHQRVEAAEAEARLARLRRRASEVAGTATATAAPAASPSSSSSPAGNWSAPLSTSAPGHPGYLAERNEAKERERRRSGLLPDVTLGDFARLARPWYAAPAQEPQPPLPAFRSRGHNAAAEELAVAARDAASKAALDPLGSIRSHLAVKRWREEGHAVTDAERHGGGRSALALRPVLSPSRASPPASEAARRSRGPRESRFGPTADDLDADSRTAEAAAPEASAPRAIAVDFAALRAERLAREAVEASRAQGLILLAAERGLYPAASSSSSVGSVTAASVGAYALLRSSGLQAQQQHASSRYMPPPPLPPPPQQQQQQQHQQRHRAHM